MTGNDTPDATNGLSQTLVVKVGTSSITVDDGTVALDLDAIAKLCDDIVEVRSAGHRVVLVSSAAIAAGMHKLGLSERPRDFESLQALSAVGQPELMRAYDEVGGRVGLTCGQVLLAPPDFFDRARYLRARSCIDQQLTMGVLPIINENDAVADDAIRFGDNDRIAALVAHLVGADLLVLLTDTAGLLTGDPRIDASASLIEEIQQVDREVEALAGGSSSSMSQGGMASKLAAAKIASWSGVDAMIAAAHRPAVLRDALGLVCGDPAAAPVGTWVRSRPERLGARKLWIAFGVASQGRVIVDEGAQAALRSGGGSLLAVGVTRVDGEFVVGDAVDVAGSDGVAFAKGLVGHSANEIRASIGAHHVEVIHRDGFVVLPEVDVPS